MRKFWTVTAKISVMVITLGIGIWAGAVYHDHVERLFRASDSPKQITADAATDKQSAGKPLFHCGMHPWIIQDHPGTCPICHMQLTPMQGGSTQTAASSEKKILYYWDPMLGPSSISKTPGKSAMGMDLLPVYSDDVSGGPTVRIDPAVVQNNHPPPTGCPQKPHSGAGFFRRKIRLNSKLSQHDGFQSGT